MPTSPGGGRGRAYRGARLSRCARQSLTYRANEYVHCREIGAVSGFGQRGMACRYFPAGRGRWQGRGPFRPLSARKGPFLVAWPPRRQPLIPRAAPTQPVLPCRQWNAPQYHPTPLRGRRWSWARVRDERRCDGRESATLDPLTSIQGRLLRREVARKGASCADRDGMPVADHVRSDMSTVDPQDPRHTGLQGGGPLAGPGRPAPDPSRRARDARSDGAAPPPCGCQAARRGAGGRLAAHDRADRGADRDSGRARCPGALGFLQHLLHSGRGGCGRRRGPGRYAGPARRHTGVRLEGRDARGVLVVHRPGVPLPGRPGDDDRRRWWRRDRAGAQGRPVRAARRRPGAGCRRPPGARGVPAHARRERRSRTWPVHRDGGRDARRQRGDDRRSPPALPARRSR